MKKVKWMLLGIVVMGLLLAACGGPAAVKEEAQSGLANPASVYCQGLGYTEETRENAEGQYGVCIFPDNSECDTWDFLAGRCGQEHSYCVQNGYTLQENPASNIATCVFPDGTSCLELDYFQGKCGPEQ
jgi:putative hemolysin